MARNRNKSRNRSRANDAYSNVPARIGALTPSLAETVSFPLIRYTNDYQGLISQYRNNWLVRRIVSALPAYAMKAWPVITSEIDADDRKHFDRTLARTRTKDTLLTTVEWARLFGGAGALLCIAGHEDMLDQPLDLDTVELGSFKGIIPFDRWSGLNPSAGVCTDISRPLQFGLPEHYQVHPPTGSGSFKVHASRILRFTGPMVPSPEYQAQSYWGISVLEPIWDAITHFDSSVLSIVNLLFRAQILSEKNPALDKLQSGAGVSQQAQQQFFQRMQMKNHLISNQGLNIIGEDGALESVQYSFSGVAEVLQQLQLIAAGAAETPVSILFGRTISGLGQSNDADLQIFADSVARWQNSDLRPVLEQQLYPVVCMSEFGQVPEDLDIDFPSITTLTDKDKRDLEKAASESIFGAYDRGIYGRKSTLTALKQLADTLGLSTPIRQSMIDEADDTPIEGDIPGSMDLRLDDGEGDETQAMERSSEN